MHTAAAAHETRQRGEPSSAAWHVGSAANASAATSSATADSLAATSAAAAASAGAPPVATAVATAVAAVAGAAPALVAVTTALDGCFGLGASAAGARASFFASASRGCRAVVVAERACGRAAGAEGSGRSGRRARLVATSSFRWSSSISFRRRERSACAAASLRLRACSASFALASARLIASLLPLDASSVELACCLKLARLRS